MLVLNFLPVINILDYNFKKLIFFNLNALRHTIGLTHFYKTQQQLYFYNFESILMVAQSRIQKIIKKINYHMCINNNVNYYNLKRNPNFLWLQSLNCHKMYINY